MNQVNGIRLPVFGCERDEAEMFRALAPRFGVTPELFGGAPSEAAARAVGGARYISVSHKTRLPASVIYPLRDAGVEYISSRSVGLDHIDVAAARRAGIAVGNTEYSPDGVADYAVMLLLMAVRGAKRTVAAALRDDFRLSPVRGSTMRDLTVGVIDQITLRSGFFRIHQEAAPENGSENAVISVPAELPASERRRIGETAKRIYTALGCEGLARVDMFLREDGVILLGEVNTMPGFTSYSRFPRMLRAAGVPLPDVIDRLITAATRRRGDAAPASGEL